MSIDVSVVLPTYERIGALRRTFSGLLRLSGAAEVIVVDDGSRDGTAGWLDSMRDPQVRVFHQPRNFGSPAARNLGAAEARGEWVLFAEDDCAFPRDYATVLRAEAERHGADVVGAPMVHPRPGEAVAAAAERLRRERTGVNGVDQVAGFPDRPMWTPLLPAPMLVRRSVVLEVGFDPGFRGNAYREETDFALRATYAGARCLLTPATYFWEVGRFPGGQPRPLLRTEWWTARNNWRFLRRHRCWLAANGYGTSPVRSQAAFLGRRLSAMSRRCGRRSPTLPADREPHLRPHRGGVVP
jgi:GT2 family glycosyltransferase